VSTIVGERSGFCFRKHGKWEANGRAGLELRQAGKMNDEEEEMPFELRICF